MLTGSLKLADAVASPALILSDEEAIQLNTKADLKKLFAGAAEAYGDRGVAATTPEIVEIDRVIDRLIHAKIRWPYFDESGDKKGEEVSTYIIWIDRNGQLRIRVALPW